ncbi:MAG: hypothetical protein JXR83_14810, partial [Deltaproteobacteria bacterium]|nr:hypothetical protein [Deltaproteobacteria bacterium]
MVGSGPARILRLALTLVVCASAGAVCSRSVPPLVLSGDERLSDGPISIDQSTVRALCSDAELLVRGRVQSSLSWPLSGEVDVALRDLDEAQIAGGHASISGNGTEVVFEVPVGSAPRVESEDGFARHVLHIAIAINGYRLQLRRSLYVAFDRPDAEVRMPARALPGAPLPVVAVQSPIADRGWLRALTVAGSSADEQTLATTEFDSRGAAATLVPVPAGVPPGTALAVEASDAERRHRLTTGTLVAAPVTIELWVSGNSVPPEGAVEAVAWLRTVDQTAAAWLDGALCLGLQGHPPFVCHAVRSDRAGLAATRFAIASQLAGQGIAVSARFDSATAEVPIAVAAEPAVQSTLLELTSATTVPGAVAARLHAFGALTGRRLHAELRLDHEQGPLVAESNGALAAAETDLQLPTPSLARPAGHRWSLLAGVSDPLERRSAVAMQLYAIDDELAVGVALPDWIACGVPFAAAIIVRDVAGAPVTAGGTISIGGTACPFDTIAPGIAAVDGLLAQPGDDSIEIEVQDGFARPGTLTAKLPIVTDDQPRLALAIPPLVPGSARIAATVDRFDVEPVAAWTTVAGIALDAIFDAPAQFALAAHPGPLATATTVLAVDRGARLVVATGLSLAPDPTTALELVSTADQTLLPVVRDRGGVLREATFVLDRRRLPLPDTAAISTTAAREAVSQLESPASRSAVVRAVASEPGERTALLTAAVSAAAIAICQAKVATDLDAIAQDISDRLARQDLTAAELPDWVQRRAHVYYDPWGQAYLLELRGGRLWLTSNGLDEQAATDDDAHASRYLHDVLLPTAPPELPTHTASDWAASIAPERLEVVATGAPLPEPRAGDRVLARTADGVELSAVVAEGYRPRLELLAQSTVRFRRNDRFALPIAIAARAGRSVVVSVASSDPTAIEVLPPTTVTVLTDTSGFVSLEIQLRTRSNASADVIIDADDGERTAEAVVRARPDDIDQDQLPLAVAARRLQAGRPLSFELPAALSGSRHGAVLRAQLYASPGALADEMSARILESPAVSVAQVRTALEAAARDGVPLERCDDLLAQLAVLRTAEGGLAAEQNATPQTEATLEALEAMAAVQSALGTELPLLRPGLGYLVRQLDAEGALAPSTGAADAVSFARLQLRASARLARLLALYDPAADADGRAQRYVREHRSAADDALTLAHVLRALVVDPLAATDLAATAAALRDHQWTASPTAAHAGAFDGLPGDGPDSDVLATAQALTALREAGEPVSDLDAALGFLVRWAHPDRPRLTATVLAAWQEALTPYPATAPARASLRLADGSQLELASDGPAPAAVVVPPGTAQMLAVESIAGDGAVVVVWLEGEPVGPRTAGPPLALDLPPLSTWTVGE